MRFLSKIDVGFFDLKGTEVPDCWVPTSVVKRKTDPKALLSCDLHTLATVLKGTNKSEMITL